MEKEKQKKYSCRKVRFSDENSALFTIKKINETASLKKKPTRAYLCSKCNSWHLTSKPDLYVLQDENKKLKTEIEKLNKSISDLNNQIKGLNDNKELRLKVKIDEQVKQLKHVNSITMKKLKEERNSNKDFINRISVSVSLLEKCFLKENLECDGQFCTGCWRDLVNQSLKQLKKTKDV